MTSSNWGLFVDSLEVSFCRGCKSPKGPKGFNGGTILFLELPNGINLLSPICMSVKELSIFISCFKPNSSTTKPPTFFSVFQYLCPFLE